MRRDFYIWLLGLFLIPYAFSYQALSEQLRYIDSSGNVKFVDKVSQIPQRYKSQVVAPTPEPVIDQKAVKLAQQERQAYQQQQMQRQKKAQELQKKQDLEQQKRSSLIQKQIRESQRGVLLQQNPSQR